MVKSTHPFRLGSRHLASHIFFWGGGRQLPLALTCLQSCFEENTLHFKPGKQLGAWTVWRVLSRWPGLLWSNVRPRPRYTSVIGQSAPEVRGSGRTSAHARRSSAPWPFDHCWQQVPCRRLDPEMTKQALQIRYWEVWTSFRILTTAHDVCQWKQEILYKTVTNLM